MILTFLISLAFVVLTKTIAYISTIVWFAKKGDDYSKHFKKERGRKGNLTEEDTFEIFDTLQGGFFPFGIRDYKLRRLIIGWQRKPLLIKISSRILFTLHKYLFQFQYLIPICVLVVFTTSSLLGPKSGCIRYSILLLQISMLVMNLLLLGDLIVGYHYMGSYAPHLEVKIAGFVATKSLLENIKPLSEGAKEMLTVGSVYILTLLNASSSVYVATVLFQGFDGAAMEKYLGIHLVNFVNWIAIFLQCIYFTFTTFTTVGYGDILPRNGIGQLIAFLIEMEGIGCLVLVFPLLLQSLARHH